jgi:hypothetical protein
LSVVTSAAWTFPAWVEEWQHLVTAPRMCVPTFKRDLMSWSSHMTSRSESATSLRGGGRRQGILLDIGLIAVLMLGILALQIQWSPRFVEMGSDSGLFAYGGQRILRGDLLYRDVFDTKPPAVFYMDAAALRLGGETIWPIWGLSGVWVAATAVGLFLVLKSLTRRLAAFASASLFLVVLQQSATYQGGNSTELFALLPQVLMLGTAVWHFRKGQWMAIFLTGLLTALAFLCKPTYIALGVVCIALALGREAWKYRWRNALRLMFWFLAGFSIPLLLVAAYWAAKGGLPDLIDALFVYGSAYVRGGLSARSLYVTFRKLTESAPMANLTTLSLAGMILLVWELGEGRRGSPPHRQSGLGTMSGGSIRESSLLVFLVALVAVPLEWALVAVSGQNFGHYFITPLPAMTTTAAFALHRAWTAVREEISWTPWRFAFSGLVTALLAVALILGIAQGLPARSQLNTFLAAPYGGEARTSRLVRFVAQHTSREDTVLIWGNDPDVNFQSGRSAPSRYLFPTQLLLHDGRAGARLEEFLGAIERTQPALLAEKVNSEVGIPALAAAEEEGCPQCPSDALAAWTRLRKYIAAHYGDPENVGDWTVYRRLDGPAPE